MSRRRILAIVALSVALVLGAIWIVLHSRGVQRRATDRVTAAIEEATGWRVEIGDPRLRLWPARLVATGVTVSADDRPLVSVDRVEARWRWTALLGSPRRLDSVDVAGLDLDLRDLELPPGAEPPAAAEPVDPWRVLEVQQLRVTGGRAAAAAETLDVAGTLDGVSVAGSLVAGRATVVLNAGGLAVERQDRRLDLGEVEVRAVASAAGVVVERLSCSGAEVQLQASGDIVFADGLVVRTELATRADLAAAMGWWDPNLVTGFDASGVLELEAAVAFDPVAGLSASAVHRGGPIRLAGYELEELELGFRDGVPTVRLAGPAWGEATVAVVEAGVGSVSARLDGAPVERLLAFVAPRLAEAVPGPVRLSGAVDGTVAFPFALESLTGSVDLAATTSRGRLAVAAEGAADRWRVHRATAEMPGASAEASGTVGPAGGLDLEVGLAVVDLEATLRRLRLWTEQLAELAPGGGPLTATADVAGTLFRPEVDARARWQSPVLAGRGLESVDARATGGLDAVDWGLEVAAVTGATAAASGRLELGPLRVKGDWGFAADDVNRLQELAGLEDTLGARITGRLDGAGRFTWTGGSELFVDGALDGDDLEVGGWHADRAGLDFELGPGMLAIRDLTVEFLCGTVVGTGSVGLSGLGAPVTANLLWDGLDLGRAPLDGGAAADGSMSGELTVDGTLSHPRAIVELDWTPDDPQSAIPPVSTVGTLDGGVLRLVSGEIATEAGSAVARVTAPLGALSKPDWLWPEAPDEPVRLSVTGQGFRSEPLVAALGIEPLPIQASADLVVDAIWHPARPEETHLMAELDELKIRHVGGEIAADGPLVFGVSGSLVKLEPVTLSGPQTRIRLAGTADFATRRLDGLLEAVLAPTVARLIPYPVQIYQPIEVSAQVRGTPEAPVVRLRVAHPGGALVMRDPPLQVRDLVLSARIADGALWIDDGRATVNEGTIELGGGWDPASRQGLVAELDNVVFFVEGILSQWSGVVSIEPEPNRLAKVVGELNLVAGLWDQNVSLTGALFGAEALEPAADDPLYDVVLDLDVRGRGKVRVENNLGRLDARWDVLRVSGRAARPRIEGEIVIDPGGRLTVAGQRIAIRRGSLRFTGDPAVDPIVEIVPESEVAVYGDGGSRLDTTSLAAQGLVQGVAGAFGFENETLRPATISVETEKETTDNVMVGQRISNNVALFFATSATDVQDRTSLIQLWNLPGLKGLTVQLFEKTLTEEIGGNVFQRFQWGGSSLYDDRPTIKKLRLEGEWPIGKRRLKKATGFRRGQPFEPFLLFVAKVRMERELAGEGFQSARVTANVVAADQARTMVFSCDPGPRQQVTFEGHEPPRRVQREVTTLYQEPPLERIGFRNMEALLRRHYDAEGYPDAEVIVERRDDEVVATVLRGGFTELAGPVVEGAPAAVAAAVADRLGSPAELAMLAEDRERAVGVIRGVLVDQGYQQAEVLSVVVVATGAERAEVRVEADLGEQAVVSELVVEGSDPLGLVGGEDFAVAEGRPLTRLSVDLAASQVRAGYDAAGYSDAEVRGSLDQDADGRWIVTVRVEPGLRRTLEGVVVNGLRHTSEGAVKTGVTLEQGEILRNSDLDVAAVRVANFAPIERVDVRTVPVGTSGARVELDIVEKPRWTTEVGGGWSTERGVQARFGVRDDNLLGRGFGLNLRGRWDQTEWLGFVVASLPPLPGKRLAFTSTVGYSRGDAPDSPDLLNQDEAFWSIEATRAFAIGGEGPSDNVTAFYRFSSTHTYEKMPGFVPIDTTIRTGLLGARFFRDRFDYIFDPTSGYGLTLTAAVSRDILGSELDYWTSTASGSVALQPLWNITWIQALRFGVAEPVGGARLDPTARFYAGGQGSVRGFDRNTVGPVKFGLGGGFEPAGGGALLILNEEFRIPVWGGLRAAVFADVGQVWESWGQATVHMSVGAGVGIRWATPVGPLWADVAWPVVNAGISSTKPKFYVGIGRPF